jgi:hypothetical protein
LAFFGYVTFLLSLTITILSIFHHPIFYLKTQCFRDWILPLSSGGTYSDEPSRKRHNPVSETSCFKRKDRTMDNVQNCDSYITVPSSQTYRSYFTWEWHWKLYCVLASLNFEAEFWKASSHSAIRENTYILWFFTVFTWAHYWTLSCARSVQSAFSPSLFKPTALDCNSVLKCCYCVSRDNIPIQSFIFTS